MGGPLQRRADADLQITERGRKNYGGEKGGNFGGGEVKNGKQGGVRRAVTRKVRISSLQKSCTELHSNRSEQATTVG